MKTYHVQNVAKTLARGIMDIHIVKTMEKSKRLTRPVITGKGFTVKKLKRKFLFILMSGAGFTGQGEINMIELNKIILGNCLGVMKTFPDDCIDLTCPYERISELT